MVVNHAALCTVLSQDPQCKVESIPQDVISAVMLYNNGQGPKSCIEETYNMLRDAEIPIALLAALAPFQQETVRFMMNNDGRGLIASEMGTGKRLFPCSYIVFLFTNT